MANEDNKNIFMKDGKVYRNKFDMGGNITGTEEVVDPTEEDFDELEEAMAAEAAEAAAAAAEPEPELESEPEEAVEDGEPPEPLAMPVDEVEAEEVAVEEAPAEPEEVPVEAVEEAPVEAVEEAPAEPEEIPVEAVEEAPVEAVEEVPVEAVEEAPVEAVEETPVEAVEEAPVEAVEEAPVEAVEETPVEAVEETPAEPVEEAPVEAVEAPAESVATPTEPVATPAELVATPTEAVEMEAEDDESEQSESSYYMEEVKKPIRKKNDFSRFIAAALIVSVAGGASMGAGYAYVKYNMETPEAVTKVPIVAQPVVSQSQGQSQSQSYSAVEVIKAVKPTVVSISTETVGETQYFGAFTIPYEAQSAGSGVVFFSDNDRVAIATNNHVIEGTTEIFVTFDEDITVPAKVVGTKSDSDLAVIVVNWDDLEEQGMYDVSVAAFGDSDLLEVGAPVFAIGNAMGEGISATDGIISMTEQTIIIDESQLTVLQTSAAINGGNSGGALVNTAGEVIGINTAKYNPNQAEGMGYAIPSNEFVTIIEDLLLNGTMPKPYIGVTGTSITADNAVLYRLPVGALIMEVVEGGPADLAGIKVGDIVTQVNGGTVMDMESLITIVNELEVGTEVDIHVVRDTSESVDLKLIVGDKNS